MTASLSRVRSSRFFISTFPFTIVDRTSSPRVTYTRCEIGSYIGVCRAAPIDTVMRSARLPTSSDPISFSIPSARAPPIVAMSSAVCAGTAVGSCVASFARNDAWRIAPNMSRSLLLAAPSVPRPSAMPAARYLVTGAVPLASFMLLSGLCDTPTPCFFRIWMSSSFTQTPCAASVRGPQKPSDSRYPTGVA